MIRKKQIRCINCNKIITCDGFKGVVPIDKKHSEIYCKDCFFELLKELEIDENQRN
jgi:hypothetical protein